MPKLATDPQPGGERLRILLDGRLMASRFDLWGNLSRGKPQMGRKTRVKLSDDDSAGLKRWSDCARPA